MPCSNEPTPALECQSFNMTSVFERIDQQLVKYKRHKLWKTFFQSGKGSKAALATLKAYAPAISYFIMGFRDFNEFVLPYETPQNALQTAINEHAKEDCTHYKLFIEDWEKLGGDKLISAYDALIPGLPLEDHHACITETFATMRSESAPSCSTKMLSFLWSDATNRHNRKLFHNCTRLVHTCGEDPAVRFAMIETVEETGLIVFSATSALVREITKSTGVELRYFGNYHLALETGHLVNQEEASNCDELNELKCGCEGDETLKNLPLTELQYNQCIQVVDAVASYFTEWLDGIYNMMIQCN
ncbi:unnamed protein product [Rotaria socialis]|uniref:Thiaminase-2/PQQC domain-containing protein n=1 Tax=Rotaria socialis TaxID=392032 RepID=A0A817PAE5_9BILA|nr:unnamed protein product [Rotaria socialis]CAF4497831.1 unnamed protein product [Rotaria socialis]